MNIKDRMILEDYRLKRKDYVKLDEIVGEKFEQIAKSSGIQVMGLEHRVKQESSLEGKLVRWDHYQNLLELTDLVGMRVILYFADDVDRFGHLVEQAFDIDWANSSDKRALLDADTFGYLSLHYICSLPKDQGYPEELTVIRFEVQIRTILQHAWAQINHDTGYKSKFGVPRILTRRFARLSSLFELADDEFVRIRDDLNAYIADTREKIENDHADDVALNMISLREYMLKNRKLRLFLQELAQIEGSEISEVDPESYVDQLKWFGITTIGQLQEMLNRDHDLALALAQRALGGSELDLLSSNAALRFLCRAELLRGGYTEEQAAQFILLTADKPERAARQARNLFRTYESLCKEGKA